MATIKLKHVNVFTDRHGRERAYFRFPGQKAVKLTGRPGSPEFMVGYNMALGFVPQLPPPAAPAPKAGARDFNALAKLYFETDFLGIPSEKSKSTVAGIINRFIAQHGHRTVAAMNAEDCKRIFGKFKEKGLPGAHNDLLKRLRVLFKFAMDLDWCAKDPTRCIDFMELGTFHTWTEIEIEQFEGNFAEGSRGRTAFALALYTGQRVSDLARMKWADINEAEGTITVIQQKTKGQKTDTELVIPCHPDLLEALASWRRTIDRDKLPVDIGGHIITNQFGKPMKAGAYGEWMAGLFDDATLPDRCVTHGLRKAAARRLAESGCSAHEIMSITGHKTLAEVERYCKAAKQLRLAHQAVAKMREFFRNAA